MVETQFNIPTFIILRNLTWFLIHPCNVQIKIIHQKIHPVFTIHIFYQIEKNPLEVIYGNKQGAANIVLKIIYNKHTLSTNDVNDLNKFY